jgi:hypothetical protein
LIDAIDCPEAAPLSPADREIQVETPETARRSPARYLWAALIARIYDRHSAPPPDKKYIKLGALITYFGNRH